MSYDNNVITSLSYDDHLFIGIDSQIMNQCPNLIMCDIVIIKTHLKLKSLHFCIDWFLAVKSFWDFAQNMAVSLPCSVQNLKRIWQLKQMLWSN